MNKEKQDFKDTNTLALVVAAGWVVASATMCIVQGVDAFFVVGNG